MKVGSLAQPSKSCTQPCFKLVLGWPYAQPSLSAAYAEYNLSILLLALSQGFAVLSLGFPECEISPALSQEKAWLSQALPACKNGLNCS